MVAPVTELAGCISSPSLIRHRIRANRSLRGRDGALGLQGLVRDGTKRSTEAERQTERIVNDVTTGSRRMIGMVIYHAPDRADGPNETENG